MHYYQFNVADYRKDTVHLTPIEHYIYRWLIDQYYLNERPLNGGSTKLCRKMGLPKNEYETMVISILEEFFTVDNLSKNYTNQADIYNDENVIWRHERIDQQIEEYQQFIERQSAAGKASAKKRAQKKLNGGSTKSNGGSTSVQPTNNHKPINNKGGRFTPPSVKEVAEYCSERNNNVDAQAFVDHYEANGWMRGKAKVKDWKACVRTWESKAKPQQQARIDWE